MILRNVLPRLEACLDDVSTLDVPLSWLSNGLRGHLHTTERCNKLKKGRTVFHSLSLREASGRNTCVVCLPVFVNASAGADRSRNFSSFLERDERLSHLCRPRSSSGSSSEQESDIRSLRELVEFFSLLRDDDTRSEGFRRGVESSLDRSRSALESARKSIVSCAPEVVREVVVASMSPTGYVDADKVATKEERALLDSSESSYLSRYLFDDWARTFQKDLPLEVRREAFSKSVSSKVRLKALSQLQGVPVLVSSDAKAEVERAWLEHVSRVTGLMLDRWEATARDLMSRDDMVVMGLPSRDFPGLESKVVETFAFCASSRAVALRLPRAVAEWMSTRRSARVREQSSTAYAPELFDASREVADTALTLWDPTTIGPYARFDACLVAAARLLG